MSNANKIARYITAIDSTPSYTVNIFVVKPMTVTATFFFFIHTLLKLMMKNSVLSHLSRQRPFHPYQYP